MYIPACKKSLYVTHVYIYWKLYEYVLSIEDILQVLVCVFIRPCTLKQTTFKLLSIIFLLCLLFQELLFLYLIIYLCPLFVHYWSGACIRWYLLLDKYLAI